MYSKQEASQLRQAFWTAYGQYMAPLPSAEGEKINWVNYKTGEKGIFFRMQADNKKASIAIEITHAEDNMRRTYYEHFVQLKRSFQEAMNEEWVWTPNAIDEHGKEIGRIYKELAGVSLFRKEEWPAIISFLKQRMIALDAFWNNVKYSFEALR
jgi:hypothetical protein